MDRLLNGRLGLLQPSGGYRFSVDSLLLAGFARSRTGPLRGRVLDLGAGCGVVGLALAWAEPEIELTAVELQPQLADLARRNAMLNGFGDRVRVGLGDYRAVDALEAAAFETVVVNPPFRPRGTGRLSPNGQRNTARHELTAGLDDWTRVATRCLTPKGRLMVVFPVWRLAGLLAGLNHAGLNPKRLRLAYTRPGGEGRLALVEARPGGGEELKIAPPLYIHDEGQNRSAETQRLFTDLEPV